MDIVEFLNGYRAALAEQEENNKSKKDYDSVWGTNDYATDWDR